MQQQGKFAALNTKDASPLSHWIRSILQQGLFIDAVVIETDAEHARAREQFWIKELRTKGHALLNRTKGGEGGLDVSATTRKRISLGLRRFYDTWPDERWVARSKLMQSVVN